MQITNSCFWYLPCNQAHVGHSHVLLHTICSEVSRSLWESSGGRLLLRALSPMTPNTTTTSMIYVYRIHLMVFLLIYIYWVTMPITRSNGVACLYDNELSVGNNVTEDRCSLNYIQTLARSSWVKPQIISRQSVFLLRFEPYISLMQVEINLVEVFILTK